MSQLYRDTARDLCSLENHLSIYLSFENQVVKSVHDFEEILKYVLFNC